MTVYMSSVAGAAAQFFSDSAVPLAGGKIYTYLAGTTTPATTYTSSTGGTANANPIILDSGGRVPYEIWLTASTLYKFVIKTSTDTVIGTYDNIPSVGDASTLLAALAASDGSSLIGFLQSGSHTVATTVQSKLQDTLCVFDFMTAAQINAVKTNNYTGVTAASITTAVQNAIDTASGRMLYCPAGHYKISSTLTAAFTPTVSVFAPGMKLIGDGIGSTFFDTQVASAPMIDIDSATHGGTYNASMGSQITGITITNLTGATATTAIRILNGYEVKIDQCYILGMTQDGIELRNGLYSDDGWNMVSITQCWIDSCARWGIKADGSAARNEGSYTYLRQVLFQSNGTSSASTPPPSGGMIYKGQVFVMDSCAFANGNQNVGLYIKGESGLSNTIDIRDTTFENCYKRSLYCTGVSLFKGRNVQFYNNDTYVATAGCEFDGASYTVRQVDIDGCVVRATSGNNAIVAFKFSGASLNQDSCRVRNVVWDNFDYAGQTRFSGVQFDQIVNVCCLSTPDTATVLLQQNNTLSAGNTVPLRLRGPSNQTGVGVASTSGEWIQHQVPSSGILYNPATLPLAINTQYYVYLYDANGTPTLTASTTTYTIDTATGYPVKTGDATMYYVGSIYCGATPGAVVYNACGWLNPLFVPGSQEGVFSYLWTDTSAKLRVKYSVKPTSDTDGVVVGTQT